MTRTTVHARTIVVISLAAAGMALGSHLFGWPSLVVLALGWGLALPALRIHSIWVGVAALLAWTLLLTLQVVFGGAAEVARLIGGILGVHGFVAVAATLLLAFVLGWSGAGVTSGAAAHFWYPAQPTFSVSHAAQSATAAAKSQPERPQAPRDERSYPEPPRR